MSNFLYNNSFQFRVIRHSLFFLVTILLFSFILFIQNNNNNFAETLWITSLNSLFFFGYAYITIFLLIPEFLLNRKIGWFIVLFLLIGVGLSALKLVVSDRIFYAAISPENIRESGYMEFQFIVVNTKDMTFIVAFFSIAKYVKDFLYAENIRKKLETEHKSAQVKLIQSQFDPHFLFNTINNLYALSLLNPLKTIEVIRQMKIVLKYINEEIQKDYVELKDEISLVENYIRLEQLRYGERLSVKLSVEKNTQEIKIPPMVLFFLVENCFKHGSSLDAGNPWIKIDVNIRSAQIQFLTTNSKPKKIIKKGFDTDKKDKLKNLKKRLEIIYDKEGFDLVVNDLDNTFSVELILNQAIDLQGIKYR